METLETVQIVSSSTILSGKPLIEGRRIPVDLIVYRALYQGWALQRIQDAHNVSLAEIYAALSYYYNHEAEIDALIQHEEAEGEPLPRIRDVEVLLQSLINTDQAAKSLGITERAVRKLIDSGTLPAKKIGGAWLIHPRDLARSEVQQRRPGPRSK